jgi:hypothetical protein
MARSDRISCTDWNLAQAFGQEATLGTAFAFLSPGAFHKPELAWVAKLFGAAPAQAQIVSLLGPHPVALPGASIRPLELPALRLAGLTSDKALYRENQDLVHLLALDPLAPDHETALEVQANGAPYARHPVRLNRHGAAVLTLRDLPAGEYRVAFAGDPADERACTFIVAEYRLAPLTAALLDRRFGGTPSRLEVKLMLETFGTPVAGGVTLDLTEAGRPVARVSAQARDGLVEAAFTLEGAGPFAINVQLAADPGRTATVPLVGSRAAERARTMFSTLGNRVTGSLLPSAESRAVRGLYLEEGAATTSPFRLERVDTRKARLTALSAAGPVRVVIIDPTFPHPQPGAVDPQTAPHPAHEGRGYRDGETLFKAGKYDLAQAVFERERTSFAAPHPNYAYYIACCCAHRKDAARAVEWLVRALEDGWTDFAHLAADEDLASLNGYPPFERLKSAGRREVAFIQVAEGAALEIDVPEPVAILAVGAFVKGKPWEGWAATVAPSRLAPAIRVPSSPAPDSEVRIAVETGQPDADASVYLIVKDARLLSADTPGSRLAAGIKTFVQNASGELTTGYVTKALAESVERPYYPEAYPGAMPGAPMMTMAAMDELLAMPIAGMPEPPGAVPPPAPAAAYAGPRPGAAPPRGPAVSHTRAAPVQAAKPSTNGKMRVTARDEPEVLFAGLLPARQGKAAVTLRLGPAFCDYTAEAFVCGGLDWAGTETRFRAARDPFVSLEVPAFVHPGDAAAGTVHAGAAGGRLRVRVTCDGKPVPLLHDGRPLQPGEEVQGSRIEAAFLAGPGEYEAVVEDLGTGRSDRTAKRVGVPGKLRTVAHSLRLLEAGQQVSRSDDLSILGLRIQPALDRPFTALVDATADYGHACCEQTAAKMLAACAMYALAGEDRRRHDLAETIILSGVRRETSMWLRGRGFKMYPESPNEPNAYYTPKVARYLKNLALLQEVNGSGRPSPALTRGIEEGLAMAADAMKAFKLPWPPRTAGTCEEAYAVVRFGDDPQARAKAVDLVRRTAAAGKGKGLPAAPPNPYLSGIVALRAEAAYAAAALFRAGGAGDRALALALADGVVKDLGDKGRLYSTVDSVAAIALMSELRAARVLAAGDGLVEVDGRRLPAREAASAVGEIASLAVLQGAVAVEVRRVLEEDWGRFAGQLAVQVALEKDGRPARRFTAGDAIDLRVRLEDGYKTGDLLWVCLPPALSRVVGGGQVKRFAVDFQGRQEVVVPLAATAVTLDRQGAPGPQRFAVCVRNMFEEERAGNPGLLEVTVVASGGG